MTEIEKPDVIGATRRAETIRQGMISYAAALEAIGEAYENRDWVALGHKDWDTYCEKEFSERRLKLTREQREQAVLAFRGAGMSIRAIGSALGVSVNTVQKDLSQSDTPAEITGADGKTYAASRPAHTETSGLVGTSPVDESGEDHPAPPLGDAADVAGARDLGDETGEQEEPPVASLPVDEPEPSGAGVSRSAPAPKPAETDEQRAERERLEFCTDRTLEFSQGLVDVTMRLGDDPIRWYENVYLHGVYHARDLPRVSDCFEPDSLDRLADMLRNLATYLRETGQTL